MKKFLALALAVAGLAAAPMTQAGAHEDAAPTPTAALPSVVHLNETVIIKHRAHRRFRTVRRVTFRHGVRHVVVRRFYY